MKILQIIPNLHKGGAQRLVLNLCNELQKRQNIEVLLITFHAKNDYPFLCENINWKIVSSKVIPSISGKMVVETSELLKTIKEFQPTIIHSHLFESEMVLSQIDYPYAKYFTHFHDNMVQFENWQFSTLLNKLRLTNYYEKQIVIKNYRKNRTTFISISEDTLIYMNLVLPASLRKVKLPNAIDLNRFQSTENNPLKNKLAMIGGLWEKKGQQLAIETIAELKNRGKEIYLDLLGDGHLKNDLIQIIKMNNLEESVFLRGNVDYPEQFLNSCKLYIHTASYEPFGLVIIEAMACGLPVVCTDGFGNRDLIVEGHNGYMVYDENPILLANKIEYLLENENIRIEMGENAKTFSQKFGIVDYCDKLINYYNL